MELRTCTKCTQIKSWNEFHWRDKQKGRKSSWCKECAIAYRIDAYHANPEKERKVRNEYYRKARRKIYDHFSQNPCVDCGEADPLKLTFDHVRGEKEYTISNMCGDYGWEKIKKEIDKCDVRCANCHQRKTALERGHYSFLGD